MLGLLLAVAWRHLDDLWEQLHLLEIRKAGLMALLLLSLVSLALQGALTRQIVKLCGKNISLPVACGANVVGGLWNLVVPMGSVGYKALYLQRSVGVDWRLYLATYGLSFYASLWAAWLIAMAGSWMLQLHQILMVLLGVGVLLSVPILFRPLVARLILAAGFKTGPWMALGIEAPTGKIIGMGIYHLLGMLIYAALYGVGFWSISSDMAAGSLMLLVSLQSMVMMVTLVPGNLVIWEALAGWAQTWQMSEPWHGVIVAAMIRFANLLVLVTAALPAARFMPRPSPVVETRSED